ncbi:monovalent cation/H+ antiporter complex subunit F [Streptomyces sp. NPDC055796]
MSAVPAQAWSAAALVLLAGAVERFAGLAGTVTGAILLLLPTAYSRPSYQDLALVFAVLPSAGVLVFTRFADPVAGSGPPAGGGDPVPRGRGGGGARAPARARARRPGAAARAGPGQWTRRHR